MSDSKLSQKINIYCVVVLENRIDLIDYSIGPTVLKADTNDGLF